jgi:hypothetical protein
MNILCHFEKKTFKNLYRLRNKNKKELIIMIITIILITTTRITTSTTTTTTTTTIIIIIGFITSESFNNTEKVFI